MRKRCKRTVRDPMAAIERRLPLRQDQTVDLGIAYRVSLEALLSGNGTEQAWSTVTCALNIALVLSEAGHSADSADTFRQALDAMVRAQERAQRIGKWGFDGEGQHVVRAAFDAHDRQVESVSKGAMQMALEEVFRRVMDDGKR